MEVPSCGLCRITGTSQRSIQAQTLNFHVLQKKPFEIKSAASPPPSTPGNRPRVFCMNTVGELFSSGGLFGVICFCHRLKMSIAKFCEHSGACSEKAGEIVHMENGMTLALWFKFCVGIVAPDYGNGWNLSGNSFAKSGLVEFKASDIIDSVKSYSRTGNLEAFRGSGQPCQPSGNNFLCASQVFTEAVGHAAKINPPCTRVANPDMTAYKGRQNNGTHLASDTSKDLLARCGDRSILCPYLGSQKSLPNGNRSSREHSSTIELNLGQPYSFNDSIASAFPTYMRPSQLESMTGMQKPQPHQPPKNENLFPRKTTKSGIALQESLEVLSSIGNNMKQSPDIITIDHSESDKLTSNGTKNSLISLFLSHLGGNYPSESSHSIRNSYQHFPPTILDYDSNSTKSNFSDMLVDVADRHKSKRSTKKFDLSKNLEELEPRAIDLIEKPAHSACNKQSSCGGTPTLASVGHLSQSSFCTIDKKSPFHFTRLSSSVPSEHARASSCANSSCFAIEDNYVTKIASALNGDRAPCSVESPVNFASMIPSKLNKCDFDMTRQSILTFGLQNLPHVEKLSKKEKSKVFCERNTEHGRLYYDSAPKLQRNFGPHDSTAHEQSAQGPCPDACKIGCKSGDSCQNRCCKDRVVVMAADCSNRGQKHCCNCVSSTKQTPPFSGEAEMNFTYWPVCHADEVACKRLDRLSINEYAENVNSEMPTDYNEKNAYLFGDCCHSLLLKCMRGCISGYNNNNSSLNKQHNCEKCKSKHVILMPTEDPTSRESKRIKLVHCQCLKNSPVVESDGQKSWWKVVPCEVTRCPCSGFPEGSKQELQMTGAIDNRPADRVNPEIDGSNRESKLIKEHQTSNISSGSFAPAITQVSVSTQVNKLGCYPTKDDLMVGEESGIEKCGSSNDALGSAECEQPLWPESRHLTGEFCPNYSSKAMSINNDNCEESMTQENSKHKQQNESSSKTERKMMDFGKPNSESNNCDGKVDLPSNEIKHSPMPHKTFASCKLLNCKRKRSSLCGTKSVKRGRNHHRAGEIYRGQLDDKEVPSLDGGKSYVEEDSHIDSGKPRKYVSLSCIGVHPSQGEDTVTKNAKPVVYGNSGIISAGSVNVKRKPAKIVSLSLILSKTRSCEAVEAEQDSKLGAALDSETRESLVGAEDVTDTSSWMSQNGTQRSHPLTREKSEFAETGSLDRNEVQTNQLASSTSMCTGVEHPSARLCSRRIMKHAMLTNTRLPNNSSRDEAQTAMFCQINAKRYDKKHKFHIDSATYCCVCGRSNQEDFNRLLDCSQCLIRVHQACYGISRTPKGDWYCRPCKAKSELTVCVLCGYGGGAMTRALNTRDIVKNLLKGLQGEDTKPCLPSHGEASGDNSMLVSNNCPKTDVMINLKMQMSTINHFSSFPSNFHVRNAIAAGLVDPSVAQWVHMVCGLWTPGTRCPNVNTMSAFDVSGVSPARKNVACSICNRAGGSLIKCRISDCSAVFHPWCAHQKGLLQSEVEGDFNEKVGFYGKCPLHPMPNTPCVSHQHNYPDKGYANDWTCARTEGFNGRKTKEGFKKSYDDCGGCIVSHEQINAWLHINGHKSCRGGIVIPSLADVESDFRKEYIRYKQSKRWKHLVVYKSGIHALGLYTSQFIARGAMVVEYVGEIIGLHVADKREIEYQSGRKLQYKGACYFFRIDKEHIIDATRKGGIARFVNHSCLPNCVAKVISVRNERKVVFFAERDINPGEEITYDYNFNCEEEGQKIPCFCNSRNCRQYLN